MCTLLINLEIVDCIHNRSNIWQPLLIYDNTHYIWSSPICVSMPKTLYICLSTLLKLINNNYCKLCLYSQPFAVAVATVEMVEVPVDVQGYVCVTMDGLDQTVKHVCHLLVIESKAIIITRCFNHAALMG